MQKTSSILDNLDLSGLKSLLPNNDILKTLGRDVAIGAGTGAVGMGLPTLLADRKDPEFKEKIKRNLLTGGLLGGLAGTIPTAYHSLQGHPSGNQTPSEAHPIGGAISNASANPVTGGLIGGAGLGASSFRTPKAQMKEMQEAADKILTSKPGNEPSLDTLTSIGRGKIFSRNPNIERALLTKLRAIAEKGKAGLTLKDDGTITAMTKVLRQVPPANGKGEAKTVESMIPIGDVMKKPVLNEMLAGGSEPGLQKFLQRLMPATKIPFIQKMTPKSIVGQITNKDVMRNLSQSGYIAPKVLGRTGLGFGLGMAGDIGAHQAANAWLKSQYQTPEAIEAANRALQEEASR